MRPLAAAIMAGTLVFSGTGTLIAAAVATVTGGLSPSLSATSLLLGAVVGVFAGRATAARRRRPDEREGAADGVAGGPGLSELLAVACFAVVALRQFLWLLHERGGVLYTLLPNNYGDLPLHWTYIRYLANNPSFWPENPIIVGQRLRYPFGVDLFTALCVQLGASLPGLLAVLGLLGSALAAWALFGWGRGFAVAAFLFSGGLAGFQWLTTGQLLDYQDTVAWKNLFLALYVPQRGFLFALPAGLLLLTSGRERLLRGGGGLPAWVDGVLWGVLPLFHLHTFLFVSLVIAFWAASAGRVRAALPAFAWAVAPAAWGAWQVTDGFRAASLVWWKPGWVIGDENPLVFLVRNFGLFLPFALWALARAVREKSEHRFTIGPGLALFVALFFVMLAPWDWDNTKVMVWCYLLVLPGMEALVLARLRLPLRTLAVAALFFSGAVAVLAASVAPLGRNEVLDLAETQGVCRALAGISVRERVATVPTFNHPVALCGHPLVAGYAGHLWSHGIEARQVQADLAAAMRGESDWRERTRRVQAKLIFWGPREAREYPDSPRPWEATETLVAEGPWGRLYRLAD
jgi:hypothetical protein